MKMYGTKRILPVYGNSRPLERRINNVKIAGWKEQSFNATLVSQNDTYNDSAFLKIYGKSEQLTTVQSKNLFDKNKVKLNYYVNVNGAEQASAPWRIGTIYINPSTNIVISGITNQGYSPHYCFFDINNNLLLATKGTLVSSGAYLITTPANTVYGKFSINATDINNAMVEIGSTATAYTPFVPNSPSPDYPSTINSVSNFDLISTDGVEQIQTINFPYILRSLPDGTKDYIEIDNVNKTAKLYQNIGNVTLESGTEWTVEGAVENSSIRCTHLTNNVLVGTTLTSSTAVSSSHDIIYQLATPVITNLDYEEVATYYPYTNIYTNATIQPMLDGKIRIIDRG